MTGGPAGANYGASFAATAVDPRLDLRPSLGALCGLVVLWGSAPPSAQPVAEPAGSLISLNETVHTASSPTNAATSVRYSYRVGDGPERSAGFTGAGLRPALASNPEALAELDRFRSKRVQSVVGGTVLVAGVATSVALGINKPTGETVFDPRTGRNEPRSQINAAALVPLGVGVVGLIYAGATYAGSGRHIQRAVTIYNDGVSGGARATVGPALGASGGGVRLAVSW